MSTPVRRTSGALLAAARPVVATERLILALKTAGAATVAWYLAPLLPFADADYSYYAPLGVLVSMHLTVADSLRGGALALVGLGSGILLGLGGLLLVVAGAPGVVAVALVVAVGALLGGIQALGVGRTWIAFAGLFVLLLGGRQPDEFSLSYLITMAFGVVVGVVANYVFPPVYLREVGQRLAELRIRIADALRQMADMVGEGSIRSAELARVAEDLAGLSSDVAADVRQGAESRRANPRARHTRGAQKQNDDDWWMLEWSTFFARDLADLLARYPEISDASSDRVDLLTVALRHTADAVAGLPGDGDGDGDGDGTTAATAEAAKAAKAIERYLAALDASGVPLAERRPALAAVSAVGSLVDMTRGAARSEG
ncbi:MAG TPA: FUSC family protein [Microbacterium sp.]|nr:FUSC family protein [Microbacterium sp.]